MNDRAGGYLDAIGETAIATIEKPVPALFLHCAVFAAGNRLVGDETFRLASFQGQETISEPFEYRLELHGDTSPQHGCVLKFEEVIGRPVTVGIQQPSSGAAANAAERFQRAVRGAGGGDELALFNGIVTAFSMDMPGVYGLAMRPALWKLSLTNRYEIHRQKNIRDTIAALLDRHRVAYSMDAVSGDDNPAVARIQDWLQAGETDLEFLRRLMGKAHLFYYIAHSGNSHKVVFVNRPAYPYPSVFAHRKPLRYTATATDELGMAQNDVIAQYSFERTLVPTSVRGVFTRQEAAWEADAVAQFQSFAASSRAQPGELPFHLYKIYQYGCSTEEVNHFTNSTGQAMATAGSHFSGSSYCAHFRVGHQFGVTGAVMGDSYPQPVRPSLEGQRFVLTEVKHQASADGGYRNDFQAAEAHGFVSPFSVQETQQGSVLAKVVAHGGTLPPQDWRYYTASYFDSGTATLTDAAGVAPTLPAMGVYVRFSTDGEDCPPVWVKLAPHMQTVPEIGVTVIVARAQDESELPEIQSIVQANGSRVIMPSGWTANTHVGSSYSTNYGDGQNIRFGRNSQADLAHATGVVDTPYRSGSYRDTSYAQGASYSFSCAESNAVSTPDQDELFGPYAGASDLLSASESFGSTYSRQHAQVSSSYSNVGTSYSKSVLGKSESRSTINGTSYSENIHGGNITSITTINADSDTTTTQAGNSTSRNTTTGNVTSTTSVSGASSNSSTYTGTVSSVTTHNGNVTSVTTHADDVSSTTSIAGNSTNTSAIAGISKSTNTQNIAINLADTLVQTNSSTTVVSNSNDVTAVNNRNSMVGVSLDISVTGSTTSVSMTGNNNSVVLCGPGFHFEERATQPKIEIVDLRLTMIDVLQIYL